MKSVFDPTDRDALLSRLNALEAGATRQWGTMNPAQMLTHCSLVLETATGDRPMKQKLLGKIVTPLIRSSILGEKPFSKNSPTDPTFVVSDAKDFVAERKRLVSLLNRFVERGPAEAGRQTHTFFGKLSGEEWGQLTYKHLDHHLRQFGV